MRRTFGAILNSDLDDEIVRALTELGGGSPRHAIKSSLADHAIFPRNNELSNALARLQRAGRAFAHDRGGSLSIWGGVRHAALYWSTREQLVAHYGYGAADFS